MSTSLKPTAVIEWNDRGTVKKYTIEEMVGTGSFGITYKVSVEMEGNLGRAPVPVAMKEFFMRDWDSRNEDGVVLPREPNGVADLCAKIFQKESKRLSHLRHPNIVSVLDAFEANGTYYYTMEYLPGGSLNSKVNGRGIPEAEAIPIITEVGNALSYMHEKKMMHLDVKPENIMMKGDATPVLIDFGLTKQFDAAGEPGSTVKFCYGTPGYAPVEQQCSEGKGLTFQPTIDIYAMGATLYKMLTGVTPPNASEVMNKYNVLDAALDARRVSTATKEAIKAAMSPKKGDRPQTVADFLAMLPSVSELPLPGEDEDDEDEDVTDGPVGNGGPVDDDGQGGGGPVDDGGQGGGGSEGNAGDNRDTGGGRRNVPKKPLLLALCGFVVVAAIVFSFFLLSGRHECVDLGLSVQWATCNVGARNPSDYGDYFAWGEIKPKSTYTWKNYRFREKGNTNNDVTFTKYNTESKSGTEDFILTLEKEDDVASVQWKGSWRMPTDEEWMELKDRCDWTWTRKNGTQGYVVTGPNGNSIFLPAAGIVHEAEMDHVSSGGRYWSSSLNFNYPRLAWYFFFDQSNYDHDSYYRFYGRTIRPVKDKK